MKGKGCKGMLAMAALGMLACVAVAAGPYVRPLGFEEMAMYGATHAVTLDFRDLTETADNAAQTNTVTIGGPCRWSYVGWRLDRAFDSSSNTNIGSVTYSAYVGASTGVALVTNVQVAADTGHQFGALGPYDLTSMTNSFGTLTNGETQTFTVIMGAPPAGRPMALDEFDSGSTRLFLRIMR